MARVPNSLKPNPPLTPKEFASILSRKGEDKVKLKAYAIYLVSQGETIKDVAKILGKSDKTIRSWIKAWNEKGDEGLKDEKRGEESRS